MSFVTLIRYSMATLYGILAMCGVAGNMWMLYVLLSELCRQTNNTLINRSRSMFSTRGRLRDEFSDRANSQSMVAQRRASTVTSNRSNPLYICLFVLSFTDLLFILSVPLLAVDIIQHWQFGTIACKLFWYTESLNKIYSPLVLIVLSADRYVSMRQVHFARRSSRCTVMALGVMFVASIMLSLPVVYQANVHTIGQLPDGHNGTIDVQKCIVHPDEFDQSFLAPAVAELFGDTVKLSVLYDMMRFLVGFVCPLLCICVTYGLILWFVWTHVSKSKARSRIPMITVVGKSALIVAFYFVCWTPYWIMHMIASAAEMDVNAMDNGNGTDSTTLASMMNSTEAARYENVASEDDEGTRQLHEQSLEEQIIIVMQYLFHSLPYVQAAYNWLLYAYLNKSLRAGQSNVPVTEMYSMTSVGHVTHASPMPNDVSPSNASSFIDHELRADKMDSSNDSQPLMKCNSSRNKSRVSQASLLVPRHGSHGCGALQNTPLLDKSLTNVSPLNRRKVTIADPTDADCHARPSLSTMRTMSVKPICRVQPVVVVPSSVSDRPGVTAKTITRRVSRDLLLSGDKPMLNTHLKCNMENNNFLELQAGDEWL